MTNSQQQTDAIESPLITFLSVGVVVAVGAIALAQSWQRWFDPIVDAGRDLYIAERLAHGARLYRDIRYQYPPLAPYLLSLVVRLFGASLGVFTAVGIAQSVATVTVLYAGAWRLAGRWAAFVAALVFTSLNFTGATTFGSNYVIPYSYAATQGMLFLVAFFVFVIEDDDQPWRRALALALALGASWCKVEYAIAVGIVIVALAVTRRLRHRDLIVFSVAALLSLGAACAFFGGTAWLRDDVFASSLTHGPAAARFFSAVAGLASWPERVADIAIGTAAIVLIVLLLRDRRFRWLAVVVGLAVGALMPVNVFFRSWGLLQWIALAWAMARDRRDVLLPLAALSIAATLRVPLNVAPWWYGFVLIVPVYLLVAYVLFEYLPLRGVYERRTAVLWMIVFALFAFRGLADQRLRFSVKEFAVRSERGTFYDANPDRAIVLNELMPRLHGVTLSVIPEGIGINYLAGARTPLSWYTFIPPETAEPAVEMRVLAEFESTPPQSIIFVRRSLDEFGYRGFGIDYDQRLATWIRSHYAVEQAWQRPRFQLVLMRRNQ